MKIIMVKVEGEEVDCRRDGQVMLVKLLGLVVFQMMMLVQLSFLMCDGGMLCVRLKVCMEMFIFH